MNDDLLVLAIFGSVAKEMNIRKVVYSEAEIMKKSSLTFSVMYSNTMMKINYRIKILIDVHLL